MFLSPSSLSVLWDLFYLGKVIFPDPEITAHEWSVIYSSPPQKGLVFERYSWSFNAIIYLWSFISWKRKQGVSGRVLLPEVCYVFLWTGSAASWLGDRTKSLHLDCGGFTCVARFTHWSFFQGPDAQLGEAVFPLTVCWSPNNHWHVLPLGLHQGTGSLVAHAEYTC